MGSEYREPRPKSPERLKLVAIESAKFIDQDTVQVKATLEYDRWCCDDMHEIVDAVAALERALESGIRSAEDERLEGLKKELEDLREDLL